MPMPGGLFGPELARDGGWVGLAGLRAEVGGNWGFLLNWASVRLRQVGRWSTP